MKFALVFAWYILWVGAYWDRQRRWLYISPIPCFGIVLKFPRKEKPSKRVWVWEGVAEYDGGPSSEQVWYYGAWRPASYLSEEDIDRIVTDARRNRPRKIVRKEGNE